MASVPSFTKSDTSSEVQYRTHTEYTWEGDVNNRVLKGIKVYNEIQHTYVLSFDVTTKRLTVEDPNAAPSAPLSLHIHLVNELSNAINSNLS